MKKWMKISLGVLGGIILLFAIDFICIFTINRPLFAIKEDNGDSVHIIYRGLLYDTYNCNEYPTPQIKLKGNNMECLSIDFNKNIKSIVDNTETCDTAIEKFYEDSEYRYLFGCIKSQNVIVTYNDGTSENIKEALEKGKINISDLDRFNIKYTKEKNNITLEDINAMIINYINNDKNDKDNYVHNYIDTERNKVVVGLVDNTVKKQEEFISKVFSKCCGSLYIKYIKENSMIEFEESKYTFEAKIIEAKENEIIVKVLKGTKQFKKNDELRMKIARPTNGTSDFYVVGNNVKITAKGIILTSNPVQIDVINIELAS